MMFVPKQAARIETATLTDGDMRVSVLNYGAITQGWWYKDIPLILGLDDPTAYFADPSFMGTIVGRVANRIGGAQFTLRGECFGLSANENGNTLHGGEDGLAKQFWTLEQNAVNDVTLRYLSPVGESGFPGAVRLETRVTLLSPRLIYRFAAYPDRPTPISLAQHNYYTLGSSIGVDDHLLTLAADQFLEKDDNGIPSGRVRPTRGDALDLTSPRPVGSVQPGIDHYFCFDQTRDPRAPVAVLRASSGLVLSAFSDQPGAQIYSGARLAKPQIGSAAVCIEPSGYPNAPNIASFPSVIHSPENPYHQVLSLEISEDRYEH